MTSVIFLMNTNKKEFDKIEKEMPLPTVKNMDLLLMKV